MYENNIQPENKMVTKRPENVLKPTVLSDLTNVNIAF